MSIADTLLYFAKPKNNFTHFTYAEASLLTAHTWKFAHKGKMTSLFFMYANLKITTTATATDIVQRLNYFKSGLIF